MQDQYEKSSSRIQKIKDRNGLTRRGRTKWKYFDDMNDILGNRPATRPPVVIDTTSDEKPKVAAAVTEDPPVSVEEEDGGSGAEAIPACKSTNSAVSDSEADTRQSSTPVKGAASRPRTNFCLVARDLYRRNYC